MEWKRTLLIMIIVAFILEAIFLSLHLLSDEKLELLAQLYFDETLDNFEQRNDSILGISIANTVLVILGGVLTIIGITGKIGREPHGHKGLLIGAAILLNVDAIMKFSLMCLNGEILASLFHLKKSQNAKDDPLIGEVMPERIARMSFSIIGCPYIAACGILIICAIFDFCPLYKDIENVPQTDWDQNPEQLQDENDTIEDLY